MCRDIGWSPIRVRATIQWAGSPSWHVNINRFGDSGVGIHRSENLHDFRLDLVSSEPLDVERPISLKRCKNVGRCSSISTYSNRDKDDARTRKESDMIQALPDGILSPLLPCIQSHLMRINTRYHYSMTNTYLSREPESLVELEENLRVGSLGYRKRRNPNPNPD